MAIDIQRETPISLTEAAGHIPRRRRGRKAAPATLYRWSSTGFRGVRLETIQIGGTRCTSVQALQRFFDRLSTQRIDGPSVPAVTDARRQERADRHLEELWKKRTPEAVSSED